MSKFLPTAKYDPVSVSNLSVVYASVGGFAERKTMWGVDFDFVVEVYWSDGRTTFIKRTYGDFLEFNKHLTDFFRRQCEKGLVKIPIFIPKLEGRKLFMRFTRDLAESREEELHMFLKDLLQGNPMISSSPNVVSFFESRSSDPIPSRDPPDGSPNNDVTEDTNVDDEDEDEIIFTR